MSGDVQPRKRKDKKRRKGQLEARRSEEYAEERINLTKLKSTSSPAEDEELFGHFKNPTDEVLHIQKEAGLGGNICTKVIFFLLLAAIGITVGLILVEYHGSTDEDVIYNDEAPWNVAIKEWVEYLPVLPDILRAVRNSNRTPDEDNRSEENDREMFDEIPETEEASSKEDLHPKKKDVSEEELFPEAVEALKKEASELIRAQAEAEEKASEPDNDPVDNDPAPSDKDDDSETEGMALKFGVGVALIVVAHMVLVKKWNSWVEANEAITTELKSSEQRKMEETSTEVPTFEAVRSTVSPLSSSVPVQEETVQTVYSAPVSEQPMPEQQPSIVQPVGPEEVSEEEEEEEEEEEVVELEGGDDEIDEDIGLSPKRYQELIAKYGQPTPESSDIEQSDDEPAEVREYSDGGENESVGEEESANELEESEPEEPEQTFIKVEKPVAAAKPSPVEVESEEEEEVEEEEEEEESEDEPPPPPPVKKPAPISKPTETRTRGGPKDTDEDYPYAEITNSDDWAIKEELDLAEEEFNFDRIQSAMDKFTLVLTKRPKSPRALYGLARAFDNQAEAKSSNKLLDKAIDTYMEVVKAPQVPDELFRRASERLINRLRFRGRHMNAVPVHRELINRFNNTVQYRNDLAITYLMVNRLEDAGAIFKNTLEKWPQNAMAQSHYGLVLKLQGKMKESIPHLLAGISTDDLSTRDARLYFHLGDALARTGAADQAMKIYINGVDKGLFRSKYQRSLYNVDRLTARPWWTHKQTQYQEFFKKLEDNWKAIRDEGLSAMKLKGLFEDEAESLRDVGDWKQFELFARGVKYASNCNKAPITCSIIESFPPARSCKRGQTKFSIMEGGTHVWPHCGPTNCRLRAHLGLVIPNENIAIRVADETRKWAEGKVFVFDDSFEHEVWHNGTKPRLVLIVDVWHPELTLQEIRSLSAI
ncbi:hypothetical protein O3M35_009795 [Rhynocoris fuscipes]|uniref:Aspartyl/asparaginy/proline hydroxylase domain-containing protein n=1 Tax=Rhynocoris fuscipes TaxID=488301 RepID=A0AAW1D5Q1_9HEMI